MEEAVLLVLGRTQVSKLPGMFNRQTGVLGYRDHEVGITVVKVGAAVFVRQNQETFRLRGAERDDQQVLLRELLHPERPQPGVNRRRAVQHDRASFHGLVADLFRQQHGEVPSLGLGKSAGGYDVFKIFLTERRKDYTSPTAGNESQ